MGTQASVRVEARFDRPIEAVWRFISDFAGMPLAVSAIHDLVVTGSGIGAVRRVSFENIFTDERLDVQDETGYRLVYTVIAKSAEVLAEDYSAEMALIADGPDACRFSWESRFSVPDGVDAEAVRADIRRAYVNSIEDFRAVLAH
jgi:uncharacterized protein YndB with AHSA1/START domain